MTDSFRPILRDAKPLRRNQRLGKYRIERKLGDGGFAAVYAAMDLIEGVRVALKIPQTNLMAQDLLDDVRREIRFTSRLCHPNILALKTADVIDGQFVMAFPLGEQSLADRLTSRISQVTAVHLGGQLLDAVAYAHRRRVLHCDIKPDNLILFPDGRLKLADFGIAKVASCTIRASGSGTLGYLAPEQAMGQPSPRSDVFSCGMTLYRMLSGRLPEWPYAWPPPGHDRLQRGTHPRLVNLIRRSIAVDPRRRFADAVQMLDEFRAVEGAAAPVNGDLSNGAPDCLPASRIAEFQRSYGAVLETRYHCRSCEGPISEAMHYCPWCGDHCSHRHEVTRFPIECPRCRRGLKSDWEYCPWCFGPGFEVATRRQFPDARYIAKCHNPACVRRDLMRYMRYCPWCRRKVRRKWEIPGSEQRCSRCDWGVVGEFWRNCPWCGKLVRKRRSEKRAVPN